MGLASQEQAHGLIPGHGSHHQAAAIRSLGSPLGWRLVSRQGCVNNAGIVDWTGGDALRLVEIANAFGTFCRFNDEAPRLLRDCNVRAQGFAG
jgi:hypothetical protein